MTYCYCWSGYCWLSLRMFFAKYQIQNIVIERNNNISNEGAGISISPNGIRVIERLGLLKELKRKLFIILLHLFLVNMSMY